MLWAVLSIFALAAVAPFIVRLAGRGRAAGWFLALLPAGIFAFFLRQAPAVAEGPVQESTPWVPGLGVELSFYLDGLGLLFALLITGIGTLIVIYAGGYLAGHDELGRFYGQLLLFMGAMLGLTIADDLILFFVFFELTSLASYLLIGFYHGEEDSRVAARKALVVTGAGGLALLGGVLLLQQVTGTFQFSEMLQMVQAGEGGAVTESPLYGWILALVCLGAFTKSAQFPFHFWLPAAMAGPTPVSAYLHSATMVKAGVFLLARLFPLLGGTVAWTAALVPIGAFTMLMSAYLGLRFRDLKQVLAYTTVMVLGLLVMLLGIGTPIAIEAMVTFTVVHALYKGALFMMAGNVDHETGTRDVLKLGGLRSKMPLTCIGGLLAALSMAGLPTFFGFVGKELVYEAGLQAGGAGSYAVLAVSLLANAALFAGALVVGVKPFFGESRAALTLEPHEAPPSMWIGPVVLAAGGVMLGILPALIDTTLLVPASDAILGEHHSFHLALWHGITPALGLSLATFAIGVALYYGWETLHKSSMMKSFSNLFHVGPGAAFERGLYESARGSYNLTRLLQNGKLNVYMLAILGFIVLLVGGAFVGRMELAWPTDLTRPRYYEVTLALAVVLAALVAARARSRFVAILALSVGGYSIAMLYLFFGAPDLAMTQFAIETLTLVLLVLVLANLPRLSFERAPWKHVRDGGVALGVGTVVTLLMLAGLTRPLNMELSQYLAENSYDLAKGRNIVNVILVDYRALDTLGEITVLAMAALGVYALMRLAPPDEEGEGDAEAVEESEAPVASS